jgi:hypothetical protein
MPRRWRLLAEAGFIRIDSDRPLSFGGADVLIYIWPMEIVLYDH